MMKMVRGTAIPHRKLVVSDCEEPKKREEKIFCIMVGYWEIQERGED